MANRVSQVAELETALKQQLDKVRTEITAVTSQVEQLSTASATSSSQTRSQLQELNKLLEQYRSKNDQLQSSLDATERTHTKHDDMHTQLLQQLAELAAKIRLLESEQQTVKVDMNNQFNSLMANITEHTGS